MGVPKGAPLLSPPAVGRSGTQARGAPNRFQGRGKEERVEKVDEKALKDVRRAERELVRQWVPIPCRACGSNEPPLKLPGKGMTCLRCGRPR